MLKEAAVIAKLKKIFSKHFENPEVVKIHVSPMHNRGFPDLLIVTEFGVFFIEAKAPGNTPTELQLSRLRTFKKSGGENVFCYWVDCSKKDNSLVQFRNIETSAVEFTIRQK
jgi:hypothetical protein